VEVRVWVEGLPGARVDLAPNPLPLQPGQSLERVFDISAPRWPGAQELNPIRVVVQSSDRLASDFIGILLVAYRLTRRANPVMLDEQGRVTSTR
jgi:hypothetical protein